MFNLIRRVSIIGNSVSLYPSSGSNDFYLYTPLNDNILIVGSSGSGKSFFAHEILSHYSYERDFLKFVFKLDPLYPGTFIFLNEQLSPFLSGVEDSTSSFIDAFMSSFMIENRGLLSAELFPILSASLDISTRESLIFENEQLKNNKKKQLFVPDSDISSVLYGLTQGYSGADSLLKPVYRILLNHFNSLYRNSSPIQDTFNFGSSSVFDFHGLPEPVKNFWAEYLLRLMYSFSYSSQEKKFHIYIDELHRLSVLRDSIISVIVRQIRSFGSVIAVSQSLSDLGSDLINNFGRVFIGNDISDKDLSILDRLSPSGALSKAVSSLPNHVFLDLRSALGRFRKQELSFVYYKVFSE